MLLGTFIFSVFRIWLTIVELILFSPVLAIKVAFLWFSMAFAVSYIFFLLVHQQHVLYVRKNVALALIKSLMVGFLLSSALVALYKFILQNLGSSKFFSAQHGIVKKLSLLSVNFDDAYTWICCGMVLLSGFFATHFVGQILDQWYDAWISCRYSLVVLFTTLLCWGFLHTVGYVI